MKKLLFILLLLTSAQVRAEVAEMAAFIIMETCYPGLEEEGQEKLCFGPLMTDMMPNYGTELKLIEETEGRTVHEGSFERRLITDGGVDYIIKIRIQKILFGADRTKFHIFGSIENNFNKDSKREMTVIVFDSFENINNVMLKGALVKPGGVEYIPSLYIGKTWPGVL